MAAVMKKPNSTVPPVSDAMLIVGLFLAVGYGLLRLTQKFFFNKRLIEKTESQENTVVKNKSSKKKFIWIGIVIIAFIFILSISQSAKNLSPGKTDKSSEYSEVSGSLYRNTKYNFRIKFPEGWELKSGDGPNILQKATNGNASISIGVRELPKILAGNAENINDVYTLEEFKDEIINGLKEKFPDVRVIDRGETKLDNKTTYWVKHEMTYSALDVKVKATQIQYQLLDKNILYFITVGTITDEYNEVESTIKKSISTFVLENY